MIPQLLAVFHRQLPAVVALDCVHFDPVVSGSLFAAARHSTRFFAVWAYSNELVRIVCHAEECYQIAIAFRIYRAGCASSSAN
jgi:hypothetical protein